MKTHFFKTAIVAFMLVAAAGATTVKAQKFGFYRPTVIVGGGFYAPYYGYPAFGLYGYPYYPYGGAYGVSKLDIQIANIKKDYADKIESVRMDNSLAGKDRRAKIREFRRERDEAVQQARANYYKSPQ